MSLSSGCFDTCLSAEDGWLTVWEHSTEQTYDRSQDIAIQSALVYRAHSRALASALQTAPSYYDFRLPSSDDHDFTISEAGYRLSGWIIVPSAGTGLDAHDPFAAHVSFPAPHPSGEVAGLLGLTADPDLREWRRGSLLAMGLASWVSASWDGRVDSGRTTTGPHGERLEREIRRDILGEVLRLTGMHLILTVMIDRSLDRRWRTQDGGNDERFPYREKSYKCSSSTVNEQTPTFSSVIELGKAIAGTLERSDFLGRWMAHYIAEQIIDAESADPGERASKEQAAAESILALWQRRSGLPIDQPPMHSFERVFTALDRLAGPQEPWSFYRTFHAHDV
jgi:hypothetical protein